MTNIPTKTCPHCLHTWQVRIADPVRCPMCGYRLHKRIDTGAQTAKSSAPAAVPVKEGTGNVCTSS